MGSYRGVRGGRKEREEILSKGVLEHESNQELLMPKFPLRELRVLRGDSPRIFCRRLFRAVSESETG